MRLQKLVLEQGSLCKQKDKGKQEKNTFPSKLL